MRTSSPFLRHRRAHGRSTSKRTDPACSSAWSAPRRQSIRSARWQPPKRIDFVAREEFDYTCQEVASGRPLGDIVGLSYPHAPTAPSCTTRRAPLITDMDALPWVAPIYQRDLQDRELFHRLSETSVCIVLYRARLPLQMHLLLVAADGRRSSLPRPQPAQCHRGSALGARPPAAGRGDLLR